MWAELRPARGDPPQGGGDPASHGIPLPPAVFGRGKEGKDGKRSASSPADRSQTSS